MTVFELKVATNGKMPTKSSFGDNDCAGDSSPAECHEINGSQARGLEGKAVAMRDLAKRLEATSEIPIVDATGLEGLFSIRTGPFSRVTPFRLPEEYLRLPEEQRPPPEPWPSVFKVLEDDLGLRLVKNKAVINVLKIELVQRPSAN
jgi:uncharacterized protein (TIGR03435 family)